MIFIYTDTDKVKVKLGKEVPGKNQPRMLVSGKLDFRTKHITGDTVEHS